MVVTDIRRRILTVASRLFAARGFDGTSLQDVAAAVGIRKPSLLHHFPSKEELRLGVLGEMLAHWNEALPRLLLAASGEDRFERVMRELCAFFRADPDRARLLVRETLDRPKEVRALLARSVRPWLRAVAGFIRKGQRGGEHFPEVDPEAYVLNVLRLVIVAAATAETFGPALGCRGAATERQLRELERMARQSLFHTRRPHRSRS
jgi:AcrR family transcriptional regulator